MEDLTEYLASKGIRTWPAAGSEVTAHCFFDCTTDKGKGKLYLNTETWLFDCKRCGNQGGRHRLLEHFGDRDEATYLPGADPAKRLQLLTDYANYAHGMLLENDEQLCYLLDRGLSLETVATAKLGYVPKGFSICDSLNDQMGSDYSRKDFEGSGMLHKGTEFHSGRITIPYLHNGRALQIRGKDPAAKYFTPAGDPARLYNAEALRGAETVIVTEGEFDTLITAQAIALDPRSPLRKAAVVGLPGAGTWPGGKERVAELFREAKRVYIALDPDEIGIREAIKLKDAVGSKARIVTLPIDESVTDTLGRPVKCDWTEYLRRPTPDHPWGGHNATDIVDLIDEAERSGRRIYSVGEAASKWRRDQTERPGVQLGYPSIDSIIAPGMRPGNVTVALAKTGTGKTVFLANLDWNMREQRVLHITLENTVVELFELLRRIHAFHNPAADTFDIADAFPRLRIADPNRVTRDDVMMLVEEYTADVGDPPAVVMIDYLGYLARGEKGNSSYEKTSNAIMNVKAMAKEIDAAIITPHQVSRGLKEGASFEGDEARDSGVVEETADFMFGLYRPADAVDKARAMQAGSATSELNVQFLKSRRGGKGRIAHLALSPASLAIVDRADPYLTGRVEQEVDKYNRGYSYDDIAGDNRQVALRRSQMRLAGVS